MSDIDALLKKVESFEKLALYSNRSDFLKSLSTLQENSKKIDKLDKQGDK